MQWWNEFVNWLTSDEGRSVLTDAVLPFAAIVVAGVIAALIGRGMIARVTRQRDHEARASAVVALVTAGKSAASWHSLTPAAKEHSEALASAADISVRLLPIAGAQMAADWSEHQLAQMRSNSVNYSFQADQTLGEYRGRLVTWLQRPRKAKKLFADDLDRWRYESGQPDPVAAEQQRWAEEQLIATTSEAPSHAPEVPLSGPVSTNRS